MKKILIVVALILVVCLASYFALSKGAVNSEPQVESQEFPTELFAVADSSNMVMVASVGLGNAERRKVISGRLYRNFIQLLRTNGVYDDKAAFTDSCNVGARLEFYRDTVLMGTYRLTDRIGNESLAGVWIPHRIAKIFKFLRDQGAQLMTCSTEEQNLATILDSLENARPTFTMPKFGASRKSKKMMAQDSIRDSLMVQAANRSKPLPEMAGEAESALKILDEMIMPRDTAVGEPLHVLFKNVKSGMITFFNVSDSSYTKAKYEALSKQQMADLGNLLNHYRVETFVQFEKGTSRPYCEITLFAEEGSTIHLWNVFKNASYLVKFRNGDRSSHFVGYWIPKDRSALQSFLDSLK